jgi:protein-L-isoaspartate(D-aspartate) O-methyltransferase
VNALTLYETERNAMVSGQLRARGIRDERVLEAMTRVRRHEFVRAAQTAAAYEDRALAIGDWETISQPYIVALMTEAAAVRRGDRILEVGTGSGYQAAVLAYLGARVYTVERNPLLADRARGRLAQLSLSENVEVHDGDGSMGYPEAAPYDSILVTAAAHRIPSALLKQLADGGRLVMPVGGDDEQELKLVIKAGERTITRDLVPCRFVPLVMQ